MDVAPVKFRAIHKWACISGIVMYPSGWLCSFAKDVVVVARLSNVPRIFPNLLLQKVKISPALSLNYSIDFEKESTGRTIIEVFLFVFGKVR